MAILMKNFSFLFRFIFPFMLTFSSIVQSKGDLTRQEPIEVEIFMKGIKGKVHYYEPSVLKFETGKLYKLIIKNISDSKHYFTSKRFAESIFTRKIQINKNNQKIAEIKGVINEVEVFPENSVEWWFIPIKTGRFDDLSCYVKDDKSKKEHSQMGMIGSIIVE